MVLRQYSTARLWGVSLLLVALTLLAYVDLYHNAFVLYDDDDYLTANPTVSRGLTVEGVEWAFTTGHTSNWHPLTWLSHLLDVELYGLDPRGHHLTSLALHVANTVLLFLLLRNLTGVEASSWTVAALFGVHPAHVESVAWAAERKNLLSMLFGLLVIASYAAWTRKRSRARYGGMLILFALGLMSKPMLVTLPFALLLLDVWPLGRLDGDSPRRFALLRTRLIEKAPLFVLAGASSVVTLVVQHAGGAIQSFDAYPLNVRVANAIAAYGGYLRLLFWPSGLAFFYPHPGDALRLTRLAGSAAVLLGVTAAAWRLRRNRAYLLVGWLWFLGTLVPVIGLVQVGWQAMADRYTYLPSLGLFVAVVWGATAIVGQRKSAVAAAIALVVCVVLTRAQVRTWRDTETLMQHALQVTDENYLAHNNLGHYYNEQGRPAEALPHLEEAVRIRPRYHDAQLNLGRALLLLGRVDEADPPLTAALALRPDDTIGLNNLAFSRMHQGRLAEAASIYERSLGLNPRAAETQHQAGMLHIVLGDLVRGRARLSTAASLEPANTAYVAHARGADALFSDRGDAPEARAFLDYLVASYRQAAVILAQRGRTEESLDQIERALRLAPDRPDLRHDRERLQEAGGGASRSHGPAPAADTR